MRKTPQHFRDQIDSLGIPKKDTVGLRVTHRAPAGFNTVNGQFVNNGKRYNGDKFNGSIIGLYSGSFLGRKGDVHVARGVGVKALVHEIGHHVTMTLNDQAPSTIAALDRIISNLENTTFLGSFGLRQYSMTNWRELLADCYKVRYCGTEDQWENLVGFFGKYGVDLPAATAA